MCLFAQVDGTVYFKQLAHVTATRGKCAGMEILEEPRLQSGVRR